MTNLGPLTTTFTPATGCNTEIYGIVHKETIGNGDNASTYTYKYHTLGRTETSECYPPNFLPTSAYYSPASICPSGWSSAHDSLVSIGTVTERQVTCCPRGYTFIPSMKEPWSTLSCSSTAISTIEVTVPDLSNQRSTVTVLQSPVIHAAAIGIRWTKLGIPVTASSTAEPIPSSLSSSSPGTAQSIGSGSLRDQLSVGAKVGIGLGTALGLILLGTILGLLYRLRKLKASKKGGEGEGERGAGGRPVPDENRTELPEQRQTAAFTPIYERKQELITPYNAHEAEAAYVHEVHGFARPSELPSTPYTR